MDNYCSGCVYRSYIGGCDYILVEGSMRGCKAGEGCDKKKVCPKAKPDTSFLCLGNTVSIGNEQKNTRGRSTTIRMIEKDLMRLYLEGKNDVQVAKELGINPNTVKNWRYSRKLRSKVAHDDVHITTKEEFEMIRNLYDEGFPDSEITRKTGIKIDVIRRWRVRNSLPKNSLHRGKEDGR